MIKGNGIVYNSKHNSNLGKTIGMRFNTTSKFVTPGPGAYEFFSDFEGFYKYGKKNKYNAGPGAYEFFSDFEGFYKYGKKNKYNDSKINEDVKSSSETKKEEPEEKEKEQEKEKDSKEAVPES